MSDNMKLAKMLSQKRDDARISRTREDFGEMMERLMKDMKFLKPVPCEKLTANTISFILPEICMNYVMQSVTDRMAVIRMAACLSAMPR